MFHTVLLYQRLYYPFYSYLLEGLTKLSKKRNASYYISKSCEDEYIFELFKKDGIIIILRNTELINKDAPSGEKFYYQAIEIRLNPKVLINTGEYVRVAKASDYTDICKRFKKVLKPLQDKLEKEEVGSYIKINLIENYQVKRIDYCINIRTNLHMHYIELIRRAAVPAGFWIVKKMDKKSKRKKAYEQCFYVQCSSVGINIYNKEYQMEKEFSQYERLEDAKNIIRVEIQCFSRKTNNIKQQKKWKDKKLINFIDENIAREIILYYYRRTVGFENYYTLAEARNCIKSTIFGSKTKSDIIKVLDLINQKRSVPNALEAYCESAECPEEKLEKEKKFNKLLEKIRKSGINPVTIPVNWKIETLPNLIHEIDKEFMPEVKKVV